MARINPSRLAAHVSFWAVYVVLNGILICIMQRAPIPEALPKAIFGEIFVLPLKIALTYFVFYYIIPLYLDRNQVGKLVGLTVLAFAIITVLYRLLIAWVYYPTFAPEAPQIILWNIRGLVLTLFDLFITVAAATTIKMIRLHYKSREFEQQLQREKLQSELNFLRAQTNPHFLFNTLNNLYVLARKKSDRTPDAIMMLSKIMRFVLYECRAPRISVADEAKVIRDYIELEKLRYNDRLQVIYREELDEPEAAVAPLLLLPFVENSFKHGASATTGDVTISIHLLLRGKRLSFTVENTVDADARPAAAGGIGLKNVQRQLDLLYPGQYQLSAGREDGQFKVRLEIRLSEDESNRIDSGQLAELRGSAVRF
jgi:two-component system LytT family sensor kinase